MECSLRHLKQTRFLNNGRVNQTNLLDFCLLTNINTQVLEPKKVVEEIIKSGKLSYKKPLQASNGSENNCRYLDVFQVSLGLITWKIFPVCGNIHS